MSTSPPASTSSPGQTNTDACVYLVTTPDSATSRKIANDILSRKLAACCNIVPRITSMYWWEGQVQADTEELMIIKSQSSLAKELQEAVLALHPYDTPEFISLPITGGSSDYLSWIKSSTCLPSSQS